MIKIGKIKDYNNVYGHIVTSDKVYSFSYFALDDIVKVGDIVKFIVGNEKENVAIDIRLFLEE